MTQDHIETGDDTIAVYRPARPGWLWTISLADTHGWEATPDCLQIYLTDDAARVLAMAMNRGLMTPPPLPSSVPSMDGELPRPIIVEGKPVSEATHTPGPWRVKKKDGQSAYICSGDEPRLGYSQWDGLAVVYGSDDDPRIGSKVMSANASLIAAAPGLLAACEILLARATPFANHWKDDPELVEAYAAIAKARGQS